MPARTQQSFTRPVVLPVIDGSTTPNPGTVNAVAMSSVSGMFMRWTGSYWLGMGTAFNFVQATIDFGYPSGGEDGNAIVAVAATWVTAGSVIVCQPIAVASPDHDPDDIAAEGIVAYAGALRAGIGFDIHASAPRGTWGRYLINAVGR